MLIMDDTFLTGRYKGTILTAVAANVNDQLLLVAFAIVENENTDNWLWFLANVKQAVVGDRPSVCLITNRIVGLLSALNTMKNGTQPLLVEQCENPVVHEASCIKLLKVVPQPGTNADIQEVVHAKPEVEV